VIEAFTTLEKAANGMSLIINQGKTKYMPVTTKSHLEVGPYKFQVVHRFTYIGSEVNCKCRDTKTYPSRKHVFPLTEKASEVSSDLKTYKNIDV